MKKAYLIHGTSTRDDDWFPWLEQAVVPAIELERLWLPKPFNPDPDEWQQAIDDQIPHADGQTGITIVAHSLGCVAALRFVERHYLKNVNLILVGAFAQPLPNYPQLDPLLPELDFKTVSERLNQATVITAQDDPIAPYQYSVAVANHIGAKLIVRPTGGHFLSDDGYTEFPLVKTELLKMMKWKSEPEVIYDFWLAF